MTVVCSPVEGFTGVVAGVPFAGGRATTTDTAALAYFRRHGYTLHPPATAQRTPPPDNPGDTIPSRNAPKSHWVDYALSQTADSTIVATILDRKTTKADLAAMFADPPVQHGERIGAVRADHTGSDLPSDPEQLDESELGGHPDEGT